MADDFSSDINTKGIITERSINQDVLTIKNEQKFLFSILI